MGDSPRRDYGPQTSRGDLSSCLGICLAEASKYNAESLAGARTIGSTETASATRIRQRRPKHGGRPAGPIRRPTARWLAYPEDSVLRVRFEL